VVMDIDRDYEISELRDLYIREVDLIIVEGYKQNPHPKIEVFRPSLKRERLCGPDDNLIAVASDEPLSETGVPNFALDDIAGIVTWVERIVELDPRGK